VKSQFAILRQRTFRHVFLGRAVSLLGTAIAPIALAFAVLGQPGGSATKLGFVMGSEAAAQVVFLLAGGVLADRFSRYRLMVGSDLIAFAAQGSVAGLFISRAAPLGVIAALSAVAGAASGIFYPSSRGLIPQIVDGRQLQSANALIRLSQNSAALAGASVSGVLIVGVGAGWALAIDAASFLVSAALVLTSRAPRARPAEAGMRIIADLREGWHEVRSRQWLWVCIAQFAVVNLCLSPSINVLGPVVAREHYGGALAWSVTITAQAIGLIAGSLLAMRLRPAFPLLVATIATFGFVPPFFLLAFHAPVWLVAASMLAIGVAIDVFEVLWITAVQEHIPGDKLSRVTSWDALGAFALGPVGLILVGPISAILGTQRTLTCAGSLVALANLTALLTPSVRKLPARPQPAYCSQIPLDPGPIPSSSKLRAPDERLPGPGPAAADCASDA
jgi:MFS family permease